MRFKKGVVFKIMEFVVGEYDVVVIGVGYVGIEVVFVFVWFGFKIIIFVINLDLIGNMLCNLSIGGIGKGYLVCEIDVFGGEMGKVVDVIVI